MRRKWGRVFPASGNRLMPKPAPRRWGNRRWTAGGTGAGAGSRTTRGWTPRKPRRRLNKKRKWLLLLLLVLFVGMQTTIYLDKELKGPLLFLAQIRIKQMATEAINTAITQEIAQSAEADKLLQWKLDQTGKVTGFLIDFKEQMRLTSRTVKVVEQVLKAKESMPEHIPIGHAINSTLLSSFGPRVSVTLHPASAVQAEVATREKETGINMVLVEVFIRIRTEISVVIPFDRAPETLQTEIPLSYALVVGSVPMYYYDNKGQPVGSGASQAPSITLPAPLAETAHP
jgi:sporulation protein YunB